MDTDFDIGVALGATGALVGVLLARIIPENTRAWYTIWVIMMVLAGYVVVRNFFHRKKGASK